MALLVSDPATLKQIIHHVFLPPQLPQEEASAELTSQLFKITASALFRFQQSLELGDTTLSAAQRAQLPPDPAVAPIARSFATLTAADLCHSSTDGSINEVALLKSMESLQNWGTIALQVRAQNAGLMMTKISDNVRFEVFELAPQNEEVLACKGRLIRRFPGFAVDIPTKTWNDPQFRATVAQTLATMSGQAAPGVQPQILKGNRLVDEDRDTTHPAIVSEFFMSFLKPYGYRVDHDIITICKNTRDEVLFEAAERPFRRSPTWLLIRVTLELTLTRYFKGSNMVYKAFMAFFMAKLLEKAQQWNIEIDIQYAMSAKIARRLQKQSLHKLSNEGKGIPDWVIKLIHEVQNRCSVAISKAWQEVQDAEHNPCSKLSDLTGLQFTEDTVIDLPLLDDWLAAQKHEHTTSSSRLYDPSSELREHKRLRFPDLAQKTSERYCIVNLQSFEDWCEESLRETASAYDVNTVCRRVFDLITQYHRLARSQYEAAHSVGDVPARTNNPEGLSIMILTVLDLWQAMDERAVEGCPLLAQYNPQMPTDLLQNLVLTSRSQLDRLERIESYLQKRHNRARSRVSSDLFGDAKDDDCFAVRYFNVDIAMQARLQQIENMGQQGQRAKKAELRQKKHEYAMLDAEAASMECSFYEVPQMPSQRTLAPQAVVVRHDDRNCAKCRKERWRDEMVLTVHEWPLPSRSEQARAVVFELCIPNWYAKWRDSTAYVLQDILKLHNKGDGRLKDQYALDNDPHVGQGYDSQGQRITLWTKNKTHVKTHRRTRLVSKATEHGVCVPNGTFYQYLDTVSEHFVGEYESTDTAVLSCTYSLPEHVRNLQRFMIRPADAPNGLSSNKVIASQSLCPLRTMTVDEYKELCTIPGGNRIQWYNIILQLAAPTVDFKKEETALVFLQCMHQVGPNWTEGSEGVNRVARTSHSVLGDIGLARTILENLNIAHDKMKGNWESMSSLLILTAIACRLLALNEEVQRDCLVFLQKVRETAFHWLQTLRERAHESDDHVERTQFLSKGIEIALVCGMTFDVDLTQLNLILAEDGNVSILLQCAITIAERAKSKKSLLGVLAARFQRVLHRSHPIIRDAATHVGVDRAVKQVWAAFPANAPGWYTLDIDYWLQTEILAKGSTDTTTVQINLLTGELLVDGTQHKTPPLVYQRHSTFKALFGSSSVEVMPSKVATMSFATKGTYGGYHVHIGITKKEAGGHRDLLVMAMEQEALTGQTRAWEVVPSRLLLQRLPERFISGYVHWYDAQEDSVQFRSIDTPWSPDAASNWSLKKHSQSGWTLQRGQTSLLGSRCQTSLQIAKALSPLVHSSKIEIVLEADGASLEVEIPDIELVFTLRSGEGHLCSKEYRRMVVDEDQSVGTLIGLKNKLVLKSLKRANRLLLVPTGEVSYARTESHVSVEIERRLADSVVEVHPFEVDTRLGRLVDNGSLQSKLYVAYLHAITSFALPDPLTMKTGTEQALTILRSAAVRSFEQLSVHNVEMLSKIAALSPERQYYPKDAKVMQNVTWDPELSFMAQHGDFHYVVGDILKQAEALQIFYPDSNVSIPSLSRVEIDLLDRDLIRTAVFRVAEYGAEHFTTAEDVEYQARDRGQDSERATKARTMSSLILSHSDKRFWRPPEHHELWKKVMALNNVYGAARPLPPGMMRYDAQLMQGDGSSIAPYLLSLHRTLSDEQAGFSRSALMIWLSTMSLSPDADMVLLQTVAMFLTAQSVRQLVPPAAKAFSPASGLDVSTVELQEVITEAALPLKDTPARSLSSRLPFGSHRETEAENRARCQTAYDRQISALSNDLARDFRKQWRADHSKDFEKPKAATKSPVTDFINVNKMLEAVNGRLKMCRNNLALQQYFDSLQVAMSALPNQVLPIRDWSFSHASRTASIPSHVTVDNVFSGFVPTAFKDAEFPALALRLHSFKLSDKPHDACQYLREVVDVLGDEIAGQESFKQDYVEALRHSMHALQMRAPVDDIVIPSNAELEKHLQDCEEFLKIVFKRLSTAVQRQLEKQSGGREGLHWARVSPNLFLAQLNRDRWQVLDSQWKTAIIQYGVATTGVQRAVRLLNAAATHNLDDLLRELHEKGHTNWSILDQPETLLLEVEGGIMVRAVQEDIAREMRSPSSGGNQVVQLNMGEGKSSVIVPMVAAALGDGKQLVRVVVAKPQSKQMAQMLVSKLGGLMNRRVFFLPYSRALRLTRKSALAVEALCQECMRNGGVLLLQPEHILSFKLTGPESIIAGNAEAGAIFLRIQEMFDECSRDIVDESDENFDVKFELVYTMGLRRPVEFAPSRWGLVQQLLDLVKSHAGALFALDSKTMEFNCRAEGGFPRLRILQEDVAQELIHRIAQDVVDFGLRGLPTSQQPDTVRASLLKYVTTPDLTTDEVGAVEKSGFWTANTKQALLLTRGLLAGGILQFVFCQKRWRVTYGLTDRNPSTRLAVPYRAKDSPSPRSEFSHPDVVILLTSLSYYYGGLPDQDLFTALSHLMTSDQADAEYQVWLSDVNVPVEYQQLTGINIKDRVHCVAKVFPHLRHSKGAIDYWLNCIVFPRELKEYPHKLSASGCDLGRTKTLPTTCFSGTNDSRSLLCLDMRQIDLPEQSHTAALVLEYILRPENDVAVMPSTTDASSTDAEQLLEMVMGLEPLPEVILDVGAFVLELDNRAMAEAWLAKHNKNVKHAAVFCDEQDELCVVDRKGRVEPLQTSSFKDRMDLCIVYLDEAHTRGIDLKLPVHWRAACTLGANLTKDRLVQACMRMRKLGKGQTIVFVVPDEIKESMLSSRADIADTNITSASVVQWVISQTFADIRHSMTLWVQQNHRFNVQQELWAKNTIDGHFRLTVASAEEFREEEARTLNFRYRPKPNKVPPLEKLAKDPKPRSQAIIARCKMYGLLDFRSRKLVAESERELSPEVDVDAERVVQKPPPAKARKHVLHKDILEFVLTGQPKRGSVAYRRAFHALENTSASLHFDVKQFKSQHLLASTDFAQTIVETGNGALYDSYQRSVQWVLTGLERGTTRAEYIMVISPYEAYRLVELDALLTSHVALHLYRPRFNMRFRVMNKLDFFTVGRPKVDVRLELSVMLGVFAGSLYFSTYEEYTATCKFLGVISIPAENGQKVAADGFLEGNDAGLRSSPVNFLKVLLSKVRRCGDDISKTHMGQLLDGKVFKRSDFA